VSLVKGHVKSILTKLYAIGRALSEIAEFVDKHLGK
jgi:hypothetical protein